MMGRGVTPGRRKHGEYRREEFLAQLKALRLTQTELARRVGLSRITVAHWGTVHARFPGWVRPLVTALLQAKGIETEEE